MKKCSKAGVPALLIFLIFSPVCLRAEHPLTGQYRLRSSFKKLAKPDLQLKSMVFAFQPQNLTELESLLVEQQNPQSPNYHRWLTPIDFGKRFGVSQEEYQSVVQWLEDCGFSIGMKFDNRLRIYFDGTAQDVDRAFAVRMGWYELDGKTYYSNDISPRVPDKFKDHCQGIYGLDNFPKQRPLYQVGGYNAMAPADIQVSYNLTPLLAEGIDGAGQSIAIVATSDFNVSDAQAFRRIFGLKPSDPQKFFVGANPGIDSAGGGEDEAIMDLEWAGAVAPGATIQVVIAANSDIMTSMDYILNRLFTTRVISISFGNGETSMTANQAVQYLSYLNSSFVQAAAQGQTVLVASGDEGAQQTINRSQLSSVADINYLCSSGYVVCVGGTKLNVQFDRDGNATQYLGESVWNAIGTPDGGATGGGRSRYVTKPAYQSGPGVPADGRRDVPDVAAMADPAGPGALLVIHGAISNQTWGGTSLSAPMWAGVFALVNQYGSPAGSGWANPRLYQLGAAQQQSPGAPRVFNDVTIGNNNTLRVQGFSAGTGFDLATGWGSFNGDVLVRISPPSLLNANFLIRAVVQSDAQTTARFDLGIPAFGAAVGSTSTANSQLQVGYATGHAADGSMPFGTAVFSYTQNGVVLSEVGVPASSPTTLGRVFVDCWSGAVTTQNPADSGWISVNTGLDLVNRGSAKANLIFTLRDLTGQIVATGHANLGQNAHSALFIDQLNTLAADFVVPANFGVSTRYGSLDVQSDQPISILALRLTVNRRGESLLTSTPVVDMTQTLSNEVLLFPQFVDGSGYTTMVVLVNTSSTAVETGKLQLFQDDGSPLAVRQVGGASGSSFSYSIPAGGVFVFQSDGSLTNSHSGWAQILPDGGTMAPMGAGIFSFTREGILVTQSGAPSAAQTTHARIYVDTSGGHDTGLAIVNPEGTAMEVMVKAFQMDGATQVGARAGLIRLAGNGHAAAFVGQLISGLPSGFTGVLDISSTSAFAALTLRSLVNIRNDFLLTTFPIADFKKTVSAPLIFPQIVNGEGYQTQIILLSTSSASSIVTIAYVGNDGQSIALSSAY